MTNGITERLEHDFGDFGKRPLTFDVENFIRTVMFERFQEHFPTQSKERAIAVGLQNAHESTLVAEHFRNQLILNPSGAAVERLASYNPDYDFEFAFGSPEMLEPYGKFDAAFSLHTFNFVERPEVVLSQIHRSLKDDGKLFLAVQNATAGARQLTLSMGLINNLFDVPSMLRKQGQVRFLDLEALRSLVKEAGFKIVDSGGVVLKTLSESQLNNLIEEGLIGEPYMRALYDLGLRYPELCASVYVVAEKP